MQTNTTYNLQINWHTDNNSQAGQALVNNSEMFWRAIRKLPSHRLADSRLMWMWKLPHNLPNDLKRRKLGVFKKIAEMLWIDADYAAGYPKDKF